MLKIIRFATFFAASIFLFGLISQVFSLRSYAQNVNQTSSNINQLLPTSDELSNGIIIAVVSAILGFLASIFVESIKNKNKPKKQISYSESIKDGILGAIEKDIENKVSILYDGKPTKNMFYVLFDVENTGNQQVKNQEIRFEFTEGIEINT